MLKNHERNYIKLRVKSYKLFQKSELFTLNAELVVYYWIYEFEHS
jgi:hypothetical protein